MRLDHRRWLPPVSIAHRGSRYLWPENTMEAFARAVALGYRHLETDLHITRDEVVVCIHDDTVDRTTDGSGQVSSFTFEELVALDAGYRHAGPEGFPFRGRGVRIPTFEEVAMSFPETCLVIDLKTDGMGEPLAGLIERHSLHDRLIAGSPSDGRLAEFRRATKGRVATSTGTTRSRIWFMTSRLGLAGGGDAQALQLPAHRGGIRVVDAKLVRAAHTAGLQVHAWTINDVGEMTRLLDLGVDGLVTDRPDLLKSLLTERGQWGRQ